MNIDENELLNLINSGLNMKEIGLSLSISLSTVKRRLKEHNLKTKNIKLEVNCSSCGIKILSKGRKFCSISCSNSILKRRNFKNCELCKNEIVGAKNNSRFCNRDCYYKYSKIERESRIINGDVLTIEPSKKYLIDLKGNFCELCGWGEINKLTKKVPIQLDHIDGNSSNNKIDNLRLLCPNCHSLTETFGALNKGNGREKRRINRQNRK